MKNEEKAVKLFSGVTGVGDDLIEEAGTVRKRKKITPWRGVAIAACLCLALVGTAAAAQHFGIRIIDGAGADSDFWLAGGIAYYRVDRLSDEVMALDDPFYAVRAFDSWDEMEEFIGVDIMNNPVLDASPATRFSHEWNDGVNRTEGRFLAVGSAELTSIRAIGCYEIGEANISVEGFLFTDRVTDIQEDWDERFLGYSFPDDAQVNRESHTTSSGLEVQIIEIGRNSHNEYKAVFSLSGIPFVVTISSGQSSHANHEILLQVLDGFQI